MLTGFGLVQRRLLYLVCKMSTSDFDAVRAALAPHSTTARSADTFAHSARRMHLDHSLWQRVSSRWADTKPKDCRVLSGVPGSVHQP
jgi:hypothetical protein